MKYLVYPGTFDPITYGHINLIKRASKLCDKLIVLIALNPNKKTLFTKDERLSILKKALKDIKNVEIDATDGLITSYCKYNNINCMLRGIRNTQDLENEYARFSFNKDLENNIDTIFMLPEGKDLYLSSTFIKELLINNADIKAYVPDFIIPILKDKIKK